jgi:hypothetical protein
MEDHQTLQTWKTGQRTRSMHVRRASTTKSTTRSPSLPQKQRNPSTKPVNGGSKWQELRHSVRIKATLDTEQIRPKNARIADLCDEDREKVAKLIRRIVDVSLVLNLIYRISRKT